MKSAGEFPASHQTVIVQRLGIRSGVTGFLAGTCLAGMAAFTYLVDDYKGSSHTLLLGVDEVGEKVKWSNGGAYGYSQVLLLEPKAGGYCKHIRTVVFAYNEKRANTQAACHTFWNKGWSWYNIE